MNILGKETIRSPAGTDEECAVFTIDDVSTPFVFHDIAQDGQQYTLAFYARSLSAGRVTAGGISMETGLEWTRYVVNFAASGNDVPMYFDAAGTYYLYHTKLEAGNKDTDFTLAPEDTEAEISNLTEVTTAHATSINIMQGQVSTLVAENTTIKGDYTALVERYNSTVTEVDSIKTTIGEQTTLLDAQGETILAVQTKANTIESDLAGTKQTVSAVQDSLSGVTSRVTTVETGLDGITARVAATEGALEEKADGTTVDTLTSRVATCETTLTGFEASLDVTNKKVAENEETLSAHSTRIAAAEGAVELRVLTSDFTEYQTTVNGELASAKSRLSTAESSITAMQGEIALKVEQTDIDEAMEAVDGKFSDYSTTVQMQAAISVAKDSVTQAVSETYATKSEVSTVSGDMASLTSRVSAAESKLTKDSLVTTIGSYYATLEDIGGGGRNLLLGTSDPVALDPTGSGNNTYYIYSLSPYYYGNLPKAGACVAVSFDWEATSTTGTMLPQFNAAENGTSWAIPGAGPITFSASNQSGHYVCTGAFPNDANGAATKLGIRFDGANGTVTIRNLKLECGTIPTGWTPAPEDTMAYIADVETVATQTQEKFSWLVESGTSSTDFTLTDRTATLIAQTISLNGDVKVNGDMLVDGCITAEKMAIKDMTNYATLNEATYAGYGFSKVEDSSAANDPWYQLDTLRRDTQICGGEGYRTYPCNGGETFRIKFQCSSTVQGTSSNDPSGEPVYLYVNVGLYCKTDTGDNYWVIPDCALSDPGGTVRTVSTTATLPSDARSFSVYLQLAGWYNFTGTCKVRDVSVTKMSSGELVVDGSITTVKLAANAVTADKIDVNDLFAQNITATGTITGVNLAGATGSFSGNVTAKTLTAYDDVKVYDSTTGKTHTAISAFYTSETSGVMLGSSTSGVRCASSFWAYGNITSNGTIDCSNWFRSYGNTGWYNDSYGGGWYMADATWIRSYGSKSIYQNSGILRTDGTLQVGANGTYFNASSSGASFGTTLKINVAAGYTAYYAVGSPDNTGVVSHVASHVNSSGTYYLAVNGKWDGSSYATHNIVSASSDARLKANIADTDICALDTVMEIKLRQYDWVGTGAHQKVGFVADELEMLDPKFAFGGGYNDDGTINVKTVDTFYLLGYVVKAEQELYTMAAAQEDRIETNRSQIESLQEQLSDARIQLAEQAAEIAWLKAQLETVA